MTNYFRYEEIIRLLSDGHSHAWIVNGMKCSYSTIQSAIKWNNNGRIIKNNKKNCNKNNSENINNDFKITYNSRFLSWMASVCNIPHYNNLSKNQLKMALKEMIEKI